MEGEAGGLVVVMVGVLDLVDLVLGGLEGLGSDLLVRLVLGLGGSSMRMDIELSDWAALVSSKGSFAFVCTGLPLIGCGLGALDLGLVFAFGDSSGSWDEWFSEAGLLAGWSE